MVCRLLFIIDRDLRLLLGADYETVRKNDRMINLIDKERKRK